MKYRQCKMIYRVHPYEGVIAPAFAPREVHIAWIPEELARVGKVVDILLGDGEWSHGWEIIEVYNQLSEEYVRENERKHKTWLPE